VFPAGIMGHTWAMKLNYRLVGICVLALLVVFGALFQIREMNRRDLAAKSKVKAEEVCRDIEQMTDEKSIEDAESLFWDETLYSIEYKVSEEDFRIILSIVQDCAYKNKKSKFWEASPVIPELVEKSDAELLAEGNTCNQQWRYARAETLSGTSDDSRLRATVYACKTWDDWFLGAIENSEYNDSLLAVICASEPNAPLCG